MLFLDTEFNGHGGKLISLALVSDIDGHALYGVLPLPARHDVHPWVLRHVVPVLDRKPEPELEFRLRLSLYLLKHSGEDIVADWPEDFIHLLALDHEPARRARERRFLHAPRVGHGLPVGGAAQRVVGRLCADERLEGQARPAMNYVYDTKLAEGRWLTEDGKIAAFAWDNTVSGMREQVVRQICWHVLATPTDEEWGLVAKPKRAHGQCRTFAAAKMQMAKALGLDADLFSVGTRKTA